LKCGNFGGGYKFRAFWGIFLMRSKDDIARRKAEAKFGEQLSANSLAHKAAADAHQSIITRIAEQRALRLAKKTKGKPPINGKKLPG
jgi:hypothetical protein